MVHLLIAALGIINSNITVDVGPNNALTFYQKGKKVESGILTEAEAERRLLMWIKKEANKLLWAALVKAAVRDELKWSEIFTMATEEAEWKDTQELADLVRCPQAKNVHL